jgi:malto-oligosyltrehalose synthase/4-alpha-glucanotransferase
MINPVSTYRIQFHEGFTFRDLDRIIPYLDKLGVRTLYASPIVEATPGSAHGYDSVNPQRINPEIGTEAQLRSISKKLSDRGIKWIQDIVPNHMAFHSNNGWLMDVLEKGALSPYAPFFDIDWTSPVYEGRLMVPFLGKPLTEVLDKKELSVACQNGKVKLVYFDSAYPAHPGTYATILTAGDGDPDDRIKPLLKQLDAVLKTTSPDTLTESFDAFLARFKEMMDDSTFKAFVKRGLKAINSSPERLRQVADEQAYRLCFHGETDQRINYRRFFTVNALICLNIQDKVVFDQVHALPKAMLEDGIFHGLRVDHIDGLSDPTLYLEQLREMAGDDTYIVVEKILQNDEAMPAHWPIQGATGYAYLSIVNNLFTRTDSEASFTRFYHRLLGEKMGIRQELHDKKTFILTEHMNGELDNLFRLFQSLKLANPAALDKAGSDSVKAAIGEFLILCPVYRYYGNKMPLSQPETADIQSLFNRIRKNNPGLTAAVTLLEEVLLQQPLSEDEDYRRRALIFYQRCMQFTGPLMAKGVEDTLMYTYNRFIGHDEVGDSPEFFGLTSEEFHQKIAERQLSWPLGMNATSTHDTKRGEDVRCRLNVLTDLTDEWISTVSEWQAFNAPLKADQPDSDGSGDVAPDVNDEYFIYQTLVGAYPMPQSSSKTVQIPGQDEDEFPDRLTEYLQKAMREGKRNSTYSEPNEAYEEATKSFALQLLDRKKPFWDSFQRFHRRVSDFGIINSLAQVMLKCTCPGIPDIYQGCEGWDLSMVDPDNRRPVDFDKRQHMLDELAEQKTGVEWAALWENRYDARIKLWLAHTLLTERSQNPDLFAYGQYLPLEIKGRYKKNVLAFARRYEKTWYVVAVPLGLAQLCGSDCTNISDIDWQNTRIVLPADAPVEWKNRLTPATGKADGSLALADLFAEMPLALLKLEPTPTDRSAGILLPVTSLPSAFGIGDFGPEARRFADFLSRSHQTYWQVLPLNPVDSGQGHSPYSANSSMAGSPLLISPDTLVADGLLDPSDLEGHDLPSGDQVDFKAANRVKADLLDKAYQNFQATKTEFQQRNFARFCEEEASWLDDYALYAVIKEAHDNEPWHQWDKPFRLRNAGTLKKFRDQHTDEIEKQKWFQFVFTNQWNQLKTYCNRLGIKLFGDLPFYVSYDSVDVWSHPELFSLDKEGQLISMAGVPPDYFNENGQLWGMPVFNWEALKEQNYAWWVDRLRKNIERYDLLRLDHFRAFADYWEVPANVKTATQGEWKTGPGADFFTVIKKELGELPFVAEDLGKINEAVYELRDAFDLPGMNVIQFAFGKGMPQSVNSLHHHRLNSVAYSGTHDNNTSRGWYRTDAGREERDQLKEYTGQAVSEDNVHTILGRLAYASVARIAILPMQDVLGLDESARLNTPASATNNWTWRVLPDQLSPAIEEQLRAWTALYDR